MHLFTPCLAFHCVHTVSIVISGTQQANIKQQGELIISGFGVLNHILSMHGFFLYGTTKPLQDDSNMSLNPKKTF